MLSESVSKVENAITILKEKFLQTPFSFYSETDMHCFLHNVLYQDNYFNESIDARLDDKQLIQTIRLHREYPTLGKFYKRGKLLIPNENNYVNVDGKRMQSSRGNYDLAVIDPSIEADFKHQKTTIAIELALNELDPTLWHLQNDYAKITYDVNKVGRGYLLFFVRKAGLSQEILNKRIPQIRLKLREMFEGQLASNVKILYLESPKTEPESEILLPHEWSI
jgi:hypothetical protein